MKKVYILYIVMLVVLSSFASATITAYTTSATGETITVIREDNANENIGTCGDSGLCFGGATQKMRPLINFSYCSSIDPGVTISNVILEFYALSAPVPVASTHTFTIYPLNITWEEGETCFGADFATWNYPSNGSTNNWVGSDNTMYNASWNLTVSAPSTWSSNTRINISLNGTYFESLCNNALGRYQNKGMILFNFMGEGTTPNAYACFDSDDGTNPPVWYVNTSGTGTAGGVNTIFNASAGIVEENGTYTLNLTFYDEESLNVINDPVNLDIDFDGNIISPVVILNKSFILTGRNNYSIGITNDTEALTDALLDYELSGYKERSYYLNNITLDNSTLTLKLYLLSNSNASTITFHVLEQIGNTPISNAYVKILRYYPGTGNYQTVEIAKTDSNGVTTAQLVLNNALYQFVIEKDNAVIKVFDTNKIYATTVYLYVSTKGDVFETIDSVTGIASTMTWVNATQTFTWAYSDPSGLTENACLEVSQRSTTGDKIINSQCISSSASSLTYTIPGTMTGTYSARGYVVDSRGIEFLINSKEVYKYLAAEVFGRYGTLLYILFLSTLALAGYWNPSVAIVLTLFGFGCGIALGFINMANGGYAIVVLLAIAGGIILFKLKV